MILIAVSASESEIKSTSASVDSLTLACGSGPVTIERCRNITEDATVHSGSIQVPQEHILLILFRYYNAKLI